MDVYEATRVVLARIQSMDAENAAKIMGYVLIQEQGDKEMIRLAFGPDALLHSVIFKARGDLGLAGPPVPSSPPSLFSLRARQHSSRFSSLAGGSSPTSFSPSPTFSRSSIGADELLSPEGGATACDPIVDEFQLHDHLSFLDDPATVDHSLRVDQKSTVSCDLFCPDASCRSTSGGVDGVPFPYRVGWGINGNHHRRSWSAADLPLRSDAAAGGFAWKPCLYYSRGYCKEGSACRFLHGLPEETAMAAAQSQRISAASQLMASAFPYSPLGSLSSSPSSTATKSLDFLLQQHQNESQRAEAAAAAALLRIKMERSDLAAMVSPGSRQIYLTFPSDSTFTEEDVSNYFSIYGPVQDVRIPYQQKRMFGFVTFIYPETVKLILAKGNPHFVCDARVLVKPYKEKGKIFDKCRKQQQSERGYISGCATPTGIESRGDPCDLQQLVVGARMLYNSGGQELLRRKLEEQQQSLELQRVIELQARRLMNLQLLDLKKRSLSSSAPASINSPNGSAPPFITIPTADSNGNGSYSSSQEHSPIGGAEHILNAGNSPGQTGSIANPNQDNSFHESIENNLPDSPFASPTKSSIANAAVDPFTAVADADLLAMPPTSKVDMAAYKPCFIPMPSPGAIGM